MSVSSLSAQEEGRSRKTNKLFIMEGPAFYRKTSPWSSIVPPLDRYPVQREIKETPSKDQNKTTRATKVTTPESQPAVASMYLPRKEGTPFFTSTSPWTRLVSVRDDRPVKIRIPELEDQPKSKGNDEEVVYEVSDDDKKDDAKGGKDEEKSGSGNETDNGDEEISAGNLIRTSADRRMACELRLVEVSTGEVLKQSSGMSYCDESGRLATRLVHELLSGNQQVRQLTIVSLCNRRKTETGQKMAKRWTEEVASAARSELKFSSVEVASMGRHVAKEEHLESAKRLLADSLRSYLKNADYIIIGGLAISSPDVYSPGRGLGRRPENRAFAPRPMADPGPLFIPGD